MGEHQRATGLWLPRVGSDGLGQAVALVSAADPPLAAWLHVGNRIQPLATAEDGSCRAIWAFDDRIALAAVRGAAALGQRVQRIEPVLAADILAQGDGGDAIRLTFTSPTHFRSGRDHLSSNASERRDYLFPCPERIVADAYRKWTDLGWPEIPEPNVNRIGGRILSYRVAEHWAAGQRRPEFCGAVLFDLRPLGPDERRAVWALLRFACYRGLGAHTTYGMGRIALTPGGGQGARQRGSSHGFPIPAGVPAGP